MIYFNRSGKLLLCKRTHTQKPKKIKMKSYFMGVFIIVTDVVIK